MKSRIVVVIAALALAGCGSDDIAQSDSVPIETSPSTDSPAEGILIENAWARTSAAGQTTGAIYFDLTSSTDDRLVGASVPATVAADAQVHEVVPADMAGDDDMDEMDDMGSDDTMDDMATDDTMADMGSDDTMADMGAMVMQELTDGLALTAGATVSFAPGGYHVMLLDIAAPLEVGDQIELTLDFETADAQTVTVTVAESAP